MVMFQEKRQSRAPHAFAQWVASVMLAVLAIGVLMSPYESSAAVELDDYLEIRTTDLHEAIDTLGYTPLLPSWFPEGWALNSYYVVHDVDYQWFFYTSSSKASENYLKYEVRRFTDIATSNLSFEQDEVGRTIRCNGWDVYLTTNFANIVAIWLDGNTCFAILGPISEKDAIRMIESIDRAP